MNLGVGMGGDGAIRRTKREMQAVVEKTGSKSLAERLGIEDLFMKKSEPLTNFSIQDEDSSEIKKSSRAVEFLKALWPFQ